MGWRALCRASAEKLKRTRKRKKDYSEFYRQILIWSAIFMLQSLLEPLFISSSEMTVLNEYKARKLLSYSLNLLSEIPVDFAHKYY